MSSRHFTRLLRGGAVAADDTLVLFAQPRCHDPRDDSSSDLASASRIGITIPKKAGNAVVRNRWKRWIRESFRTQQSELPRGWDFVVRPKKHASGSFRKIRRSVPRLAMKATKRFKSSQTKP